MIDFGILWQKITFTIVHMTTLWLLIMLWIISFASWFLASILKKHNARQREANLANKTGIFYLVISVLLWLFTTIMN